MARSPATLPLTTLPLNTITPHLRARLEVVDGALRWELPRTVLGAVPIGTERVSLPLATVTSTRSRYAVRPARLLVGLGLLALPLLWPSLWVVVPAMVAAAGMLLLAPAAQLEVGTSDGRTHRLGICVRHRFDVDLIAAALDDLTGHPSSR